MTVSVGEHDQDQDHFCRMTMRGQDPDDDRDVDDGGDDQDMLFWSYLPTAFDEAAAGIRGHLINMIATQTRTSIGFKPTLVMVKACYNLYYYAS